MLVPSRRRFLTSALAAGAAPLVGRSLFAADPVKPAPNPIPAANNAFTWDLYRQLNGTPGNAFFSPLSIEAALGMTAAGARGNTLTQMRKALALPVDAAATHAGFQSLFAALNDEKTPADKRGFELTVTNALWGSATYPWRKEYLTLVADSYGGGLFHTDFGQPEPARQKINNWVEGQTKQRIKDLIPKGVIDAATRLVLTNAVYFKGAWQLPFDVKQTKAGPFHLANGTKAETPLMHKTAGFAYTETDDAQAVELPYQGRDTAMVVLLPRKADGLPALEKAMTGPALDAVVKKLGWEPTVDLTLPKFKLETSYDLVPPLKALGMTDAFTAKADLSGMHTSDETLFISAVLHKAFCAVDEAGTEAAAATAVVVGRTSAIEPRKPKVFQADRPFLFVIRHKPTNTVLFAGKVETV
jgi:serpin B